MFSGPLQQLLGQSQGQQMGGPPGQGQVNIGAQPLPGFTPPNPYTSPQTPVPGMPTQHHMPQLNPALGVAALQNQGGQQGQQGGQQWNLTPLQKILAMLGSYG